MSKQTTSNPLSLAFILVLIVALVGAMFLVGQRQETRRGAYFAATTLTIEPSAITAKVGDNVPVQLFVQTGNVINSTTPAKVSGVDTKICYGTGLKLDAADVTTLIDLNLDAFKVIEMAKDADNCLRLVVVSSGIAPENLKSGLVKVAGIRFKAVAAGTGKLQMSIDTSTVAGYNPVAGASDTSMKISAVGGASYTISSGSVVGQCGWCGNTCQRMVSGQACIALAPPEGKECVEVNGACVIRDISVGVCGWCGTACTKKTPGMICPDVMPPAGKECVDGPSTSSTATATTGCVIKSILAKEGEMCGGIAGIKCEAGLICKLDGTYPDASGICVKETVDKCYWCGDKCINSTMKIACVDIAPPAGKLCVEENGVCTIKDITVSNSPWLRFRMSFLGVTPGAKCAESKNMPLKISVRADNGTMVTYNNVIPTRVDNTGNVAFYDVKLQLTGFNYTDKLAVFIKGPKHLQGKYAVNNQNKYYDKAGGELTGLTYSETTTPMFNFENYPLLVGDVTGPLEVCSALGGCSDVQDGQIDGLDFSAVKTEAGKRTSVTDGSYLLTDLNGNCQMESQDLALLMLSLSVKQGQLY